MKTKFKILLLTFALLFIAFIGYHLAIKKTIEAYDTYAVYTKNQNEMSDLPSQILNLKQQKRELDSIIQAKQNANQNQTSNLLLMLNRTLEKHPKIEVSEFKKPLPVDNNGITELIYEFSIKGDYKSSINYIYEIEHEKKIVAIKQLKMYKTYNYRLRKNELFTTLLMKPL